MKVAAIAIAAQQIPVAHFVGAAAPVAQTTGFIVAKGVTKPWKLDALARFRVAIMHAITKAAGVPHPRLTTLYRLPIGITETAWAKSVARFKYA